NATVPVAALPPVSVDGVVDTDVSDGPAGVAALTDRFAVRGTFWIAAVIWTIVGGAAAFVAIGNVTLLAPAGATTDAGTLATDGSLLKSSTVVGVVSGMRFTVPTDGAPSRTWYGDTDSDEMIPVAVEAAGRPSNTVTASNAARATRRLMEP